MTLTPNQENGDRVRLTQKYLSRAKHIEGIFQQVVSAFASPQIKPPFHGQVDVFNSLRITCRSTGLNILTVRREISPAYITNIFTLQMKWFDNVAEFTLS